MGTHQNRLVEAILMSTHNISFYGKLTKIILQLSSNTLLICSTVLCCGRPHVQLLFRSMTELGNTLIQQWMGTWLMPGKIKGNERRGLSPAFHMLCPRHDGALTTILPLPTIMLHLGETQNNRLCRTITKHYFKLEYCIETCAARY